MLLDARGTLFADAGTSGRITERRTVIRRRFQNGCLTIKGKGQKMWVARWRETVLLPDNTLGKILRSKVLGPVGQISKSEARNLLANCLRSTNQGHKRPLATITFEQFAREKWEPLALPTIKPATARYYRYQLHRYVLQTFGPLRLRDLDRETLQAFVIGKKQQGYSSSTLHGIRTTLSKVLGQAVTWRYLEENPARGLSIGERVPKKEPAFLEPRDALRLIEALPEPCRTVVTVAVLTGLRIGEIAALRWGRVDFVRGVVQVKETYSEESGFGTPKTRSSVRDVPMSEPVRAALLAHRQRCAHTDAAALVFTSKTNTPMGPKNLATRVLRPICVKLGLRPISWHVLRHTHATWLSESGATIRAAQDILGQSDVETTLRVYTHSVPESKRRAVANVAALLFPSVPLQEGQQGHRQESIN
jgi:integrase